MGSGRQCGDHPTGGVSTLGSHQMLRAGVAAHSSSAATGVDSDTEYFQYQDVWWARKWDPDRQWWVVDDSDWRRMGEPVSSCLGCDVPLIMQLKFQQPFMFVIVPQLQFIVRVLDISVLRQTVQGTVQPSQVRSWCGWSRPSLCNDRCRGWGQCRKPRWCHSCSFRRGRRHLCCGQEATLGFAVHCCEHAVTSCSSLGEHSVQKTVDFPQVQFLPDVR